MLWWKKLLRRWIVMILKWTNNCFWRWKRMIKISYSMKQLPTIIWQDQVVVQMGKCLQFAKNHAMMMAKSIFLLKFLIMLSGLIRIYFLTNISCNICNVAFQKIHALFPYNILYKLEVLTKVPAANLNLFCVI